MFVKKSAIVALLCAGLTLASVLAPVYPVQAQSTPDAETAEESVTQVDLSEFDQATTAAQTDAEEVEETGAESTPDQFKEASREAGSGQDEAQEQDLAKLPAELSEQSEADVPGDIENADFDDEGQRGSLTGSNRIFMPMVSTDVAATEISAAAVEASDSAAASNAVRGDFNGDGRDDLAIGVPYEDLFGRTNGGVVQVLYGSAARLTAAGDQYWHQNRAGIAGVVENHDQFGRSLAVGDFNRDGRDDLAIGVPYEDIGNLSNAGVVQVLYGSITGLRSTGSQMWHQNVPGVLGGAERGDLFGHALAAGDFNCDGRDDLAIGVPSENIGAISNAGVVNVLYGSGSGLTANGDQMWHQNVAGVLGLSEGGDRFGMALTTGNFNGDRRFFRACDDLAVGVPYEDFGTLTNPGVVNVLYGSAARLTANGDQYWHQNRSGILGVAENYDSFGMALTSGDFNFDGRHDLAIGVPYEDIGSKTNAGAVNVLYGSAARLTANGDQLWSQDSAGVRGVSNRYDNFGRALAAGDFNRDGRDDLAIGVPYEDYGTLTNPGVVNVLYGSAARLTAAGDDYWHQNSGGIVGVGESGDSFGFSLSVGDFNGGGYADLAIGVPYEDIGAISNAGAVNVIYGAVGGLNASGDQVWHQNSGGILGVSEAGDSFGYVSQ